MTSMLFQLFVVQFSDSISRDAITDIKPLIQPTLPQPIGVDWWLVNSDWSWNIPIILITYIGLIHYPSNLEYTIFNYGLGKVYTHIDYRHIPECTVDINTLDYNGMIGSLEHNSLPYP